MAEFFMFGDLKYQGNGCDFQVDQELPFMQNPMASLSSSQLVISEGSATCIANQIASSKLGKIHMNKEKFNAFWGTGDKLEFSTTSFSSHLPMFQDKLGANVNLVGDFSFKDMNVHLGRDGADLTLDYTMGIDVSTIDANGTQSASRFYDEIKMTTTANVRAADDIVFASLLSNKVDVDSTIG